MISEKVKQVRKSKGYSQQRLAEESGLSIRTVQRVENGETDPRGDTLIRLAEALDMTPDELLEWNQKEDTSFLAVLNISALSFLVFPLFGVIIPLVLWITKKDKIKRADSIGRQIINFQITWTVFLFSIFILVIFWLQYHMRTITTVSPSSMGTTFLIYSLLLIFLYGYNIILIGLNTYWASKGKKQWYYPKINLIR